MKQKIIRVCRNDINSLNDIEESEANCFAVMLLIPQHELNMVIFKLNLPLWDSDLIKFCSDYFNVPESVIRYSFKIYKIN